EFGGAASRPWVRTQGAASEIRRSICKSIQTLRRYAAFRSTADAARIPEWAMTSLQLQTEAPMAGQSASVRWNSTLPGQNGSGEHRRDAQPPVRLLAEPRIRP